MKAATASKMEVCNPMQRCGGRERRSSVSWLVAPDSVVH
jgi:hypothetical protein